MTTAPAGTKVNGGAFTVPDALGQKQFSPYSDFLMHNVGTGDGIVIPVVEHYGRRFAASAWRGIFARQFQQTRYRIRTAPLWGVRMRTRLMHDGASLTLRDAIVRHSREANDAAKKFRWLTPPTTRRCCNSSSRCELGGRLAARRNWAWGRACGACATSSGPASRGRREGRQHQESAAYRKDFRRIAAAWGDGAFCKLISSACALCQPKKIDDAPSTSTAIGTAMFWSSVCSAQPFSPRLKSIVP